jgi:alkanesulfonate monooxygenase SsuD/methylene tetrahydromethanopterin reductase-like flavin-dependent oxidoreductase (luciferase family)
MRPFRFGVNVGSADTGAAWTDKARRLEELGYSTLTVPDHLGDFFAPLPAVLAAAAATTRLRVGTNVLNNDFRHPVLVARSAWRVAEVDQRVRLVREAAGARYPALELNALVQRVIVTDDRRRAAAGLAAEWKPRPAALTAEEILDAPFVLAGTEEQIVEDLQRRRERWDLSYYVVFERFAEALAPVVARLAGR